MLGYVIHDRYIYINSIAIHVLLIRLLESNICLWSERSIVIKFYLNAKQPPQNETFSAFKSINQFYYKWILL